MHETFATGYKQVDSKTSCLITRFELNRFWSIIPFYLLFRRIKKESAGIEGLLKTVFVIENLRSCYTLSFWENAEAILEFNAIVHSHVDSANYSFGRVKRKDSKFCIWSAQFRLSGLGSNMMWEGLEREILDSNPESKESVK